MKSAGRAARCDERESRTSRVLPTSNSSNERSFGLWADRDPNHPRPHVPYHPRGADTSDPFRSANYGSSRHQAFQPASSRDPWAASASRYQESAAPSRHQSAASSRHTDYSRQPQQQQQQYFDRRPVSPYQPSPSDRFEPSDYRSLSPLGSSLFEQPRTGRSFRTAPTSSCRQPTQAIPHFGEHGYYGTSAAPPSHGATHNFKNGGFGWDHY